ncbi:MAG TPA: hypothetical protein C5S37_14480 [Methanophagales archaeon]|nr:hypothetical protein [Methanophagales archaeon]
MKISKYNKILATNDVDRYILYNTLRDSVFIVDRDAEEVLEGAKGLESLDTTEVKKLVDEGILVDDDVDELELVRTYYNDIVNDCTSMQFTVATTYDCNLCCPYCYQSHEDFYKGSMNEKVGDLTIKFIKNKVMEEDAKTIYVTLYGGEPLLNIKEGLRIIRTLYQWAKENDREFYPTTCTNGTLLTREIIEAMKNNTIIAPEHVPLLGQHIITLDGTKEIHNKIKKYRDGSGSFDDIIRALKMVKEAGVPFTIKFNLYGENYSSAKKLIDDLIEMGFKGNQLVISLMSNVFTRVVSESNFPEMPVDDSYRELNNYALEKGLKVYIDFLPPKCVRCKTLTNSAYVIDPYGDIYKCWTVMGQIEHKIGTLDDDGHIKDHRPCILAQRDIFAIKKCRRCIYLPICGGNCAAFAYLKYGHYQAAQCIPNVEFDNWIKIYLKQKYPDKMGKLIISRSYKGNLRHGE